MRYSIFLIFLYLLLGFVSLNGKEENFVSFQKEEKNYKLYIIARKFAQGEVLHLKIIPMTNESFKKNDFKVFIESIELPLHLKNNEFIGFLPVHPERKIGSMVIELHIKKNIFNKVIQKYELDIHSADFLIIQKQSIGLDEKFTQNEFDSKTLDYINECKEAKSIAFSSKSNLQFSEGFVNPVSKVSISSPFYVRREYNGNIGNPHGGVDYRGKIGTPIFAVNSGTVVLAREMYFEGKFTIIDHGNQIFSFYMHQSKIFVTNGKKVKRGEMIGEIGSTGMSTGPHLHLGVKVMDTLVHPLSLLAFKNL